MESEFTLIDSGEAHTVPATIRDGRVSIPPEAVRDALGWSLEPRGLCRGDVCVPVRERASLVGEAGLDLAAFASLLGRPLALDPEAAAAVLGTAAADRSAALASELAPDFALPDLGGRSHALSEHRGKKVLLIAYASW